MISVYQIIKFFIPSLLVLGACSPNKSIDKETLIQYINDENNGLVKETTSNNNTYKVLFRPTDLIVQQNLKENPKYNIDSLRKCYSDCLYFVLSLQHDSLDLFGKVYKNYPDLLKTISFEMNNYVRLIENKSGNVYYVSDFIYPRMYNSTSSTSILICFKDSSLKDINDFTFCVKDILNSENEYISELKFGFLKDDIKNLPTLKL